MSHRPVSKMNFASEAVLKKKDDYKPFNSPESTYV